MKKLPLIGLIVVVGLVSSISTIWLQHIALKAGNVAPSAVQEHLTSGVTYGEPAKISYRASPALTELNTAEIGGDVSGDGQRDHWIVSANNVNNLDPEAMEALGLYAIFSDDDGDLKPDELTLSVGAPEKVSCFIIRLQDKTDGPVDSRQVVLAGEQRGRVAYVDIDEDAMVDLIIEQAVDKTVTRWLMWDHELHQVSKTIDKSTHTYEISRPPNGEPANVRWENGSGWRFTE